MRFRWVDDRRQSVWRWIAILFALFYFTEAALFWGPNPRIAAPHYMPLLYWASFGLGIVWLVRRQGPPAPDSSAVQVPPGMQAAVLGLGITLCVIGATFLVVRVTGNVTLAHAVLLLAMCQA